MNPYTDIKLKSERDLRILDLFLKHNKNNEWINTSDIVCYCFQTNSPLPWNFKVVESFLYQIRERTFNPNPNPLLEECLDGEEAAYRLIDASLIEDVKEESPIRFTLEKLKAIRSDKGTEEIFSALDAFVILELATPEELGWNLAYSLSLKSGATREECEASIEKLRQLAMKNPVAG